MPRRPAVRRTGIPVADGNVCARLIGNNLHGYVISADHPAQPGYTRYAAHLRRPARTAPEARTAADAVRPLAPTRSDALGWGVRSRPVAAVPAGASSLESWSQSLRHLGKVAPCTPRLARRHHPKANPTRRTMSTEVKLAGRLPASAESNGMPSVQAKLLADPKHQVLAVVWLDVLKITRDVDTDDEVPTLRVLKIEPLGEVDEVSQAIREEVMRKAEARLGHTPLPFDQHDPDGVTVLPGIDEEGDD